MAGIFGKMFGGDEVSSVDDARALVTGFHKTLDESRAELEDERAQQAALRARWVADKKTGIASLNADVAAFRATVENAKAAVAAAQHALAAAEAAEAAKAKALILARAELAAGLEVVLSAEAASSTKTPVSYEMLSKGDDSTTTAIIGRLTSTPLFVMSAALETDAIATRDSEDDAKLAKGIAYAVSTGVVPATPESAPARKVDVLGKSADAVADEIVAMLDVTTNGTTAGNGKLVVLQGLSGTGKGTTVDKLLDRFPGAVAWSNGNVFRALTMLALRHCETELGLTGGIGDASCVTPENVKEWMEMLRFGRFGDGYDIEINGLGFDHVLVSSIATTALKAPAIGRSIPSVAAKTQGEVIQFANGAAAIMTADGLNVVLEGREPTLDYVKSPYRFELTLTEPALIGQRRVAQRLMGAALKALDGNGDGESPTDDAVSAALQDALTAVVIEWAAELGDDE